ncbi:MAG: formylglycine-generating enzyme family protein [Kiritimatiellae bacterium]|nr:formylglycine-generating enzyme family protein [Kiritimatiellia bacterium]
MKKQTINKAARFALAGIAALCVAGCGKDEPPAEVNRRPSVDVMTEQKSEKTKAEAEAQCREQALPSPVHAKTKTITLPGGATMEMIWCPAGTFMMGTPESEPERQSKETLHEVTLTKGFWLGKYEVTQAQWESVMGANPSKNKNAEFPVENVTWEDCDAFRKKVGGGARFPTEAEWEYACRAGTKTPFYWGTSLNGDKANCAGDSPYGTKENGSFVGHLTKGGTYGSNPWGFCDMSGNVEEWCSDWYDLFTSDKAVDPKGPDAGLFRIIRGGYWRGLAEWCRSGHRSYGHPKATDDRRGFRLAMDE